jgi:cyclopropane fatty-acyl-phospholipid synthase-like methyltransferase
MNPNGVYEDGTYLRQNPTWHQEDSAWKADHIQRILRCNAIEPHSVCEVGCGAGGILSALHAMYPADVVFSGYEISPQAFAICRQRAAERLQFFQKSLLSVADGPFDVVLAVDVLEHVEDYFGFLRALRTKGRYKVFHIPLDLSVQTVLRSTPLLAARHGVGHLHYFTKETALATLRDTGYRIRDWWYTAGMVDLPSSNWRSRALKAPRRLLSSLSRDLTARWLGGYSLLVLAE